MTEDDLAIDRQFVRIREGLVHVRRVEGAPGRRPLCLLHLSPLSSRSLEPLMRALRAMGFDAPLIAPDTLGNGDSAPPAPAKPDIGYFADAFARALDQLGVDKVDLYGSHTGGRIACEFALAHPGRAGRLVIDGIAEYPPEVRAQYDARYTPAVKPDAFGGQLNWAFNYMRNQFLFAPWFMQDAAHRLAGGIPEPEALHDATLEMLKALGTYHLPYQAAFDYPSKGKVAALGCPTLLLKHEPGTPALNAAADAMANGRNVATTTIAGEETIGVVRAVAAFLSPD